VIGGSAIWGNVELYWDSSTGRNCAKTVATSAGYYGTASYKSVILYRCVAGTKAGSSCQTDSQVADPGSTSVHYTYYAGPVSLAAAGRCIAVTGEVDNPGGTAFAALHTPAMHCS
jgi:hypothetical protein